tara:strand:- start:2298 stop:3344 length:1047 start_codon:yes stop_codon:yes gene_type:complete
MKGLKIGYWPNSKLFDAPADRRRFIFYLENKGINFELFNPSNKYDLVYLSQAADISQIKDIKKTGAKIFYDNIDSYSSDGRSIRSIFRGIAKYLTRSSKYLILNHTNFLNKNFLPNVDAVICASDEQSKIARKFSSNVFCIPDHTHNEIVFLKKDYSSKDVINIGWEGLGSNVYQLNTLKNIFKEFSKTHKFNLHVISDKSSYKYMNKFLKIDNEKSLDGLCDNIIFHKWENESYSSILTQCDFIIIPINLNSKMASGKPENKLINIWKMGMPVITANTKSYNRVMNDCGVNLICDSEHDWVTNLRHLSDSHVLRKEIGERVYNYATKNYGSDAVIAKWDLMFYSFFK